jgi:hypothetical protein
MEEEHQQEPPEYRPTPYDLFNFGCKIAWYLCGCWPPEAEYIHEMADFLADLAAGKTTMIESPADFRAWRESFLKSLKAQENLPFDPAQLESYDPEQGAPQKIAQERRLARFVLESMFDKDELERWFPELNNGDATGNDG